MYSDMVNPFGIREGKLVTINDVQSGLSCECVCPQCKKPLIARKGFNKIHHFAHYRGSHCNGSLETALHIKAKQIFENHNFIMLPPVPGQCADPKNSKVIRKYLDVRKNTYVTVYEKPKNKFTYDSCFVETRLGKIVPDIILNSHQPFIVEIYVTHKTGIHKIHYIKNVLSLCAIEIDLSHLRGLDLIDEVLVENAVIRCPHLKKWLSF